MSDLDQVPIPKIALEIQPKYRYVRTSTTETRRNQQHNFNPLPNDGKMLAPSSSETFASVSQLILIIAIRQIARARKRVSVATDEPNKKGCGF